MIKGIDVSAWNTITSWSDIKNSGKDFVFIRLGWSNWDGTITLDKKFMEHYNGAIKAGLNVGIYLYSYLKDTSHTKIAAENIIKLISDKSITYPVVFDYEEHKIASKLTKAQNTAICKTFLDTVQSLGYFAMLYTYTSFINSYLNINDVNSYALWIADYREPTGIKCPYGGTWAIWQYLGEKGKCTGVTGACDINISKYDYAKIIKANGLNNTNKTPIKQPVIVDKNNYYNAPLNMEYVTDIKKNVITTYKYSKAKDKKLSKHFTVKEFAAINKSTGKLYSDEVKIHNRLIQLLEKIYVDFNCSKIIINSGYRTKELDLCVGGSGQGQHCLGQACDFTAYGKDGKIIPAKDICIYLEELGNVYGIGFISNFSVHIDTRLKSKEWIGTEIIKGCPNIYKLGYKSFKDYFNKNKI